MGTGAPNVEAEAAIDAQAFIGKHGLQSVAGLQVEAHGSIYSVEDAIVQCPPFAKMITGLAVGLEGLPEENRTEIITKSIRTMAVDTPEIAADTQKKTII